MARRSNTPAEREEADQVRRDKVEQLHADLAERMRTFDDLDTWQRFLTFSAGFHTYSFNNQVLLWMQNEHATLVAGYRAWQAKGHQVRRGEKALTVLAPILRKVPQYDSSGNPALDENGQQRYRPEIVGVKPAAVFDASQIDPEPVRAPRPTLLADRRHPGCGTPSSTSPTVRGTGLSAATAGQPTASPTSPHTGSGSATTSRIWPP